MEEIRTSNKCVLCKKDSWANLSGQRLNFCLDCSSSNKFKKGWCDGCAFVGCRANPHIHLGNKAISVFNFGGGY